VVGVPASTADLQPGLDDVALGALDLAAGGAPVLRALVRVGDCVAVPLEVPGFEAKPLVPGLRVGTGRLPGLSQLLHHLSDGPDLHLGERIRGP